MDEIVQNQVQIKNQFKAQRDQYDNLSEERKTIKLVHDKLKKIDELWASFQENDEKIKKEFPDQISHPYNTQDLYEKMLEFYTEFRDLINVKRELLTLNRNDDLNKIEVVGEVHSDMSGRTHNQIEDGYKEFIWNSLQKSFVGPTPEGRGQDYYALELKRVENKWIELRGYFERDFMESLRIFGDPEDIEIEVYDVLRRLTKLKNESMVKPTEVDNVRLPSVNIPKFDGSYTKWPQFRDIFEEMIHKKNIPLIEKMFYLQGSVIGEVSNLLKTMTSANHYQAAWALLKERYENKRLLTSNILDRFLNMPGATVGSARHLKQIYDTTQECILLLENSGIKVLGSWDPIMLQILIKKLDKDTYTYYEQEVGKKNSKELQSLAEFLTFIEARFRSLETVGFKSNQQLVKSKSSYNQKQTLVAQQTNTSTKCSVCQENHFIYHCKKFLDMQISERFMEVKKLSLCMNCLKPGHISLTCSFSGCKKCNKKHNVLLHFEKVTSNTSTSNRKESKAKSKVQKEESPVTTVDTVNVNLGSSSRSDTFVFLGTAIAKVHGPGNQELECRILLDSGSQVNFITEKLTRRLKLDTRYNEIEVNGIGDTHFVPCKERVYLTIHSRYQNKRLNIEAQVIKNITSYKPQVELDVKDWGLPGGIQLADPTFNKPKNIDILLGAELYSEIMTASQIKLQRNLPMLQETIFGWVVLGKMSPVKQAVCSIAALSNQQLEDRLEKFWDCEEIEGPKPLTKQDNMCEEFFKSTFSRNEDGRFVVNLPIFTSPELLGDSKQTAYRRFLRMENRLNRNFHLKEEYVKFMKEYEQLNHMQEIKEEEIPQVHYFLPHHAVIRPESSTTKTRIVFDGSSKTSTNLSLNDIMCKGPRTQDELFDILLRFRTHKYVITADIKQMYRQIQISEEDQDLQLIMWRSDPTQKLRYYKLKTVTYGTRSAPYLATRCLNQLATDEQLKFPQAAKAVKDFYVDDVITGCDDLDECETLKEELMKMLSSAQLSLHKWASNDSSLLSDIPVELQEKEKWFKDDDQGYIKTLGLSWQPVGDCFTVTTTWPDKIEVITKRLVVSETARLFDPLGLVNPIIVAAKIFIQKLWKEKMDWDDVLDDPFEDEWIDFRKKLSQLNKIKIGRYVCSNEVQVVRSELHVFADASEKAFGAAAYVRSVDIDGKITCRLLCSKSRVAPSKFQSLPRLELCAAKLAVKLVERVKKAINIKFAEIYLWSDSQITLSWIKGDAGRYKTYVAHRITYIQQRSRSTQWNYVNTKHNPADLLSRGILPMEDESLAFWFTGPQFLKTNEEEWPERRIKLEVIKEEEKKMPLVVAQSSNSSTNKNSSHPIHTIDHRNSFLFLVRTMAYILRLKRNDQNKKPSSICLSADEIERATLEIIKTMQNEYFHKEIKQLKELGEVSKALNHNIHSLTPFLDDEGIMRVGGRLANSALSYDAKYPIFLPGDHFVSRLLLNYLHQKHLHAGEQALRAILRQRFWVTKEREVLRATIKNCVLCCRAKPQLFQQLMGNLPSERVSPKRPFFNTGVDFCGPIWTHYHIRGKRPHKSYIAVFCCFSTKAIHMEVVSDLTTDAFLGALKRFIARRGLCRNIFCDNATNFVGSNNKLKELEYLLQQESNQKKIIDECSSTINFRFSPPRAPHFGGLFEAAVKSAKKLLQHTLASASLTFEELCTVVAEAEAVLNSRPLTPLSSNPNDLTALTPGHFLIGEPLTAISASKNQEKDISSLTRWELVSAIRKEFWKRWENEYLSELQKRHKWTESFNNVFPGMMVIVKKDDTPPLKWPLGRIEEVFTGNDGLVRVVYVRTSGGLFKRAIHNLAPLPIEVIEEMPPESTEESTPIPKRFKRKPERGSSKRVRYDRPFSLTMFTFVTLMFLPLLAFAQKLPFETKKIDNNAGIYIDHLGSGHLVQSHWKLVVYYNMSSYWKTYSLLKEGVQKMKSLSESAHEHDYISLMALGYEARLHEIDENNQLLFHQSSIERKKRGLFNAIGSVANMLFGVLDDDYAKKIETTLDKLTLNQANLLKWEKEQTSLLDATNQLVKKSQQGFVEKVKLIEDRLNDVIDRVNNFSRRVQQDKIVQAFSLYSQYILLTSNEFRRMQDKMLDIITELHYGKANPLILPPDQLLHQLEIIKKLLPLELKVPDMNLLYRLMTVKCKIKKNYSLFMFEIPLLSVTLFDVVQFVPFPVMLNNTFMKVITSTDLMMINKFKDVAYTLSKQEFEACIEIDNMKIVCVQQRAFLTKTASNINCELSLLAEQKLSSQCLLEISKPVKTWIQLHHSNDWLYSFNKEYVLNVVCNDNSYHLNVNGAGILSFYEDCVLKDNEITIHAYRRREFKIEKNSHNPVLLPLDWNTTMSKIPNLVLNYSSVMLKYEQIDEKLHLLMTEEEQSSLSNQVGHHHVLSYISCMLALLLIFIIVFIKVRKVLKWSQSNQIPTTIHFEAKDFNLENN